MDMLRYQSKHVVKAYANTHDTTLFRDSINYIFTEVMDCRDLNEVNSFLGIEYKQIPKWKWWWIRDYNRTRRDAYALALDIVRSIRKRFPTEMD